MIFRVGDGGVIVVELPDIVHREAVTFGQAAAHIVVVIGVGNAGVLCPLGQGQP